MLWFHSTSRKIPLIMSAAPAASRQPSATSTSGASPNPMIKTPQQAAEAAMARPSRWTRAVQPLSAEAASAPTAGAENIRPTAQEACRSEAMNGNRAFGYANVIAARSAR